MKRKRLEEDTDNKMDVCTNEVAEEINICPQDLKKVLTSAGAMSRPWVVGDFVNLNKKSLQIRGYVDYYGGYANHTRAVIDGLEQTGKYSIRLTPIKALKDIHPDIYAKMNWYTQNPSFRMKGSTFLCIGGPGWMQQEFIPQDGRRKIGWTMVETLGVQKQIVEWCNNMDTILCPTEIDRSRFKRAGQVLKT